MVNSALLWGEGANAAVLAMTTLKLDFFKFTHSTGHPLDSTHVLGKVYPSFLFHRKVDEPMFTVLVHTVQYTLDLAIEFCQC